MVRYRTHTCGQLRASDGGKSVKLAGWMYRKRDHGNVLFIDLRDHFGITQCVVERTSLFFDAFEHLRLESVISVQGEVVVRSEESCNSRVSTGSIEVVVSHYEIHSSAEVLPFPISGDHESSQELRFRYRFLDLRRERPHQNIVLRNEVIASLRKRMYAKGFMEFQTPILTASSPEGARDFLIPSRLNPHKFYALPQAPQQFKQLIMMSGFDKYFQIAPCFRDEDARADRAPGEFYQLDLEMAFVTQDDVFEVVEDVLKGVFQEFATSKKVSEEPFVRIPYSEALQKYGTDKPDLRNPLIIVDVTDAFRGSDFSLFAQCIENGYAVKAIPAPGAGEKSRSWFDTANAWAKTQGFPGLGYMQWGEAGVKGPIAKKLSEERIETIHRSCHLQQGDAVFFVCERKHSASKFLGEVRTYVAQALDLIDQGSFKFCWIMDYPMFERDEKTGILDFSHNPFSMPQGGLEALQTENPLDIKAFQYDIVCNGVELSSGAIRNHSTEIMYKVFEMVGYSRQEVQDRFGGMLRAFQYGAPPHGGSAPGIDRIVMLLADEPNIREVVLFPMNQQGQDLMMDAPSEVSEEQLRQLHVSKYFSPKITKEGSS